MILFKYNGDIKNDGQLDYPFSDSVGPVRTYRVKPLMAKGFSEGNEESKKDVKSISDLLEEAAAVGSKTDPGRVE